MWFAELSEYKVRLKELYRRLLLDNNLLHCHGSGWGLGREVGIFVLNQAAPHKRHLGAPMPPGVESQIPALAFIGATTD